LSPIQVSTIEIFADCILCFQADKEIYEISRFVRNAGAQAQRGGAAGSGALRPIPPPPFHANSCHFDPPTGGENSKKCNNNFSLGQVL